MNKKWIPVIVSLIALIPVGVGGAATNWTFQIGDNIWSSETINEGDINTEINIETEGITCEQLEKACKDSSTSVNPEIRKYCPMLDFIC